MGANVEEETKMYLEAFTRSAGLSQPSSIDENVMPVIQIIYVFSQFKIRVG